MFFLVSRMLDIKPLFYSVCSPRFGQNPCRIMVYVFVLRLLPHIFRRSCKAICRTILGASRGYIRLSIRPCKRDRRLGGEEVGEDLERTFKRNFKSTVQDVLHKSLLVSPERRGSH